MMVRGFWLQMEEEENVPVSRAAGEAEGLPRRHEKFLLEGVANPVNRYRWEMG